MCSRQTPAGSGKGVVALRAMEPSVSAPHKLSKHTASPMNSLMVSSCPDCSVAITRTSGYASPDHLFLVQGMTICRTWPEKVVVCLISWRRIRHDNMAHIPRSLCKYNTMILPGSYAPFDTVIHLNTFHWNDTVITSEYFPHLLVVRWIGQCFGGGSITSGMRSAKGRSRLYSIIEKIRSTSRDCSWGLYRIRVKTGHSVFMGSSQRAVLVAAAPEGSPYPECSAQTA